MTFEIPLPNLIAFRRAYNTALVVEDRGISWQVSTLTAAGDFTVSVSKTADYDADNRTLLNGMQAMWNVPVGGDLFDVWSHNFATNAGDWAFTVAAGKKLQVDWMRGLMSNNINFPSNNPFHVVVLLSYGAAFSAWGGTRTALTGGNNWTLDSNNTLENAQEYKRYIHTPGGAWDGQVAIDFIFPSMTEILGKTEVQDVAASSDGAAAFKMATTPYKRRDARLQLRSSLNERIECYPENGVTYKTSLGGAIDLARLTVGFSRFEEF